MSIYDDLITALDTTEIPTWEYTKAHSISTANKLGAEGWEMVAIHPDGRMIMKRPTGTMLLPEQAS